MSDPIEIIIVGFLLIFGLLGGAYQTLTTIWKRWHQRNMQQRGLKVNGIINDVSASLVRTRYGNARLSSISYEYSVEGITITKKEEIPAAHVGRIYKGQGVQVTYLPDKPKVSRIDSISFDYMDDGKFLLGIGIGIALFVFGLWVAGNIIENM